MSKLISFIILCGLLACNNSSDSSTSTDSTTTTNPTNVENVNGNVPDSSSGINLNQPLPVDSSRVKDSGKKNAGNH